jgi:ATP-binding cassette subfamily C protein LapB
MNKEISSGNNSESDRFFCPKTYPAKVLVPLLDALNWQGDNRKMIEALVSDADYMDIDGLIETMSNLNFKHFKIEGITGKYISKDIFPAIIIGINYLYLVISIDGENLLIFDGKSGIYEQKNINSVYGDLLYFRYSDNFDESLTNQQNNWFGRLVYRFRGMLSSLAILTFLITVLDLLLPIFVVLIYEKVLSQNSYRPLLLTLTGVMIYLISSFILSRQRDTVLNYISTRMGEIISLQTFTRLVYLSPSYTEKASINAQISRIKDFENLKNFVINGNLSAIFDLLFSSLYIGAIFYFGGNIGFVPIITLIILIAVGLVFRPFHKIKMQRQSDTFYLRQQSLIEILRNTDEIKMSGSKDSWIERLYKYTGNNIISNYDLSKYVCFTNSISYFITNSSVLVVVYLCVIQTFDGRMSTGILIGILMLYWKIMGSIRSVFSLAVQVNGLVKSVGQINRFMKLPQDRNLNAGMYATREIRGLIRFSEVSIRYSPTTNPALFNVSFVNSPGKILGITGHDGAGKTTILKLILGMYTPQSGRIIIDNNNIKQLEPLALRRYISYSPDKDSLFSGTFRENFRSHNPEITDSKIMELAEKTGLSEAFNLFGYTLKTEADEYLIKEFSPSFKKLFNLTQMLAREVKLYLIDEPENYLDKRSLSKIISVIGNLARNQDASIIIATKDQQIIDICDEVIRLNQGRIIQENRK